MGINYGLSVFYVDFGIGVGYNAEEIARRLFSQGLKKGGWVTLRNNPVGEKGCGILVSGLKQLGIKLEVEDEGIYGTPGWFPQVDRWILWYRTASKFNYGALRPRQDIIAYKGNDIVGFLADTDKWDVLRAVIVEADDKDKVWQCIKDKEVRVYVN